VDAVLEYITARIVSALYIVAPEKEIQVKKGPNLYLTRETLEAMKKLNAATGKRYRGLRNEVSPLVRRDKQDSNLLSLTKAKNDPKALWSLADQALGKDRPSLPALITGANGPTTTPMVAAEVMNRFFVDKVDDLRKKALRPQVPEDVHEVPEEVPDVTGEVPHVPQDAFQVRQEVGNVSKRSTTSGRNPPTRYHVQTLRPERPKIILQVCERKENREDDQRPQQHGSARVRQHPDVGVKEGSGGLGRTSVPPNQQKLGRGQSPSSVQDREGPSNS
jgi:hypothetical protein